MLNRFDLRAYRELRGLSFREVANYCDTSHTMIMDVEKGIRGLTKETHDDIVKGINVAYAEKLKGTLQAKNTKKKVEPEEVVTNKSEAPEVEPVAEPKKPTTKKSTTKKATTK